MKLTLMVFLWGFAVIAASPPELGNFSGLLFTGSSIQQAIQIQGGTYSDCEKTTGNSYEIYSCTIVGGNILVDLSKDKTETYKFDKVKIAVFPERRHYYYHGTRLLYFNARKVVAQAVKATMNFDLEEKDRVYGYIELSQSGVRSSFEAYRLK